MKSIDFNMDLIRQWLTTLLMIAITIIGFFIKQSMENQRKESIRFDDRLTIVEDEIIANMKHLISAVGENTKAINEIRSNRYTSKDAEKERSITNKDFEIVHLKMKMIEEKIEVIKNE